MSTRKKVLIFSVGAFAAMAVVAYMFIADVWNQYVANILIADYAEMTADSETYADEYAAAVSYNESLPDSEELYESLLNISGTGMMGYISIPKINVCIPIYHYTSDESLAKGAGHMYGTSLPVGGKSTHAVISAHRGLPEAKLFSDLDQMETGDLIYINVLGELLAYEVYGIETVLPEEVDSLSVISGEDIITLVTCTPYGVNTHRLLVHAKRVELTQEEKAAVLKETAKSSYSIDTDLLLALCLELAVYAAGLVLILKRGREEKEEKEPIPDIDKISFTDDEWKEIT